MGTDKRQLWPKIVSKKPQNDNSEEESRRRATGQITNRTETLGFRALLGHTFLHRKPKHLTMVCGPDQLTEAGKQLRGGNLTARLSSLWGWNRALGVLPAEPVRHHCRVTQTPELLPYGTSFTSCPQNTLH